MPHDLRLELIRGVQALSLASPDMKSVAHQADLLLDYIALLTKWNTAYNLTAVREPRAMIGYHLLDSLSVLPHVTGQHIIDVGTGPGLPGIPLAIACPERQFMLLDSNGKKTRFCLQAAGELGLTNVAVTRLRVEHYRPSQTFDTVISRAFATLGDFVSGAGHLVSVPGRMLAMKGALSHTETAAMPAGFRIDATYALQVPCVDGDRNLVEITPI